MRKRNIIKIADTILWYTIYLLPILGYLFYLISYMRNPSIQITPETNQYYILEFAGFFSRFNFATPLTTSPIYSTLSNVFGPGGVFPLVGAQSFFLIYMNYLCVAFLFHLIVDVILFIPRFAMKWMDEFTKE